MSPKITHLDLNPSCNSRGSEHNLGSFSGCWRLVFLQPYLQYPASASCHIPSADCSARWWRPPDATWVPAFDWQRRHGDPHSRHNPADHICRRWKEASLIRLLGYSSRMSSFLGDSWGGGAGFMETSVNGCCHLCLCVRPCARAGETHASWARF